MRSTRILGTVGLVLVLIQGCAPGYNSVLFATRSNLGFDADTTPPNLEISISRLEGVLEPTFEGGQTLPVMASFSSRQNGVTDFFWGVNSTFATGEAAFTMTYLYDDDTPCKAICIPYERVTLEQEPALGCKAGYIGPGNVKPVLFGTDTLLGIKVQWTGQTGQYPSAVNIGFKRKEATLAPIAVGKNRITDPNNPNSYPKKKYEADMSSMLATLQTDVSSATSGTSVGLKYLQYFATGSAANNLARQHAVRLAMLQSANPPQAEIAQELRPDRWGKVARKPRDNQKPINYRNLIDQITGIFNCADVNKKNTILAKAKTLKLVDDNVTITDFPEKLAMRVESGPKKDLDALQQAASAP